jgi:hypothetical protein
MRKTATKAGLRAEGDGMQKVECRVKNCQDPGAPRAAGRSNGRWKVTWRYRQACIGNNIPCGRFVRALENREI